MDISAISLGTWAFGSDSWWGHQESRDSFKTIEEALHRGVNLIDTAPVYGRGHAEEVLGEFFAKNYQRDKVILATKAGLSWQERRIFHDLSEKKMLHEIDESRRRLRTDYIDLYQVHWPDPAVPIAQTAAIMQKFLSSGIIKAVGVSNFSINQIEEFMKYCPVHCVQPEFSMFKRDAKEDIIPFCVKNNIGIISYAPLYSSILTGKFFFEDVKIPGDINRKIKKPELSEPRYSINKKALSYLKELADSRGYTLTQLALSWNFNHEGITSSIVGMRKSQQVSENLSCLDFSMTAEELCSIDTILNEREASLKNLV